LLYGAERIAAGVALIGLAPLFALIALAIAILSRRGPFVRHQRVGWKGTPLGMIKLRTMWDQSTGRFQWVEDVGGPVTDAKHEYDVRVTSRFAALCRRYSIDELPQLYHVVRGEMSLVGPRPVTRAELESH
jgi:lipopolysaccharide/colanic/teichoic acid biosynthesis glycosyltransferase